MPIELGGGDNAQYSPNFDAQSGCDLRNGIPLPDNSIDMIFSRDFFEHLTFTEGLKLLNECKRVLMVEGTIEFIIPNMAAGAARSSWDNNFMNTVLGTQKNQFEFHKMWWTPELICYILKQEGWRDITTEDYPTNGLEPKFIVRAKK